MTHTSEVLEQLTHLSPDSLLDQSLEREPSLTNITRAKLRVSAIYLIDVLNHRLKPLSEYKTTEYTLTKNLRRLLHAWDITPEQWQDTRRRISLDTKERFELERDAHGDVTLKGNGVWARQLGWFSPSQIKLHLLKNLINAGARCIPHLLLGDRPEEGQEPISRLINRVTARLQGALHYEQTKGLLPKSRDENLATTMDAIHRSLVFLCEEDTYYRVWFGFLATVIWEEMTRFYDEFTFARFTREFQGRVRFEHNGVPQDLEQLFASEEGRRQVFYWYLCKHLPFLEQAEVHFHP